ncbi:MAG: hypothetical protein COB37_06715 [Kordiimonadales bacterium]|nr:MAG: hypothetical protein COB37_06715 [Kordiimonadales bacterium]
MLDKVRSYLMVISFVVIAGLLGFYLYVLAKGDDLPFGSKKGDLQPAKFETTEYQFGDEGFLLCPAVLCKSADPDGDAEIFNISASKLRQVIADYSDHNPSVELHNFDFGKNQFEFLERSPGETFPTVVSIRVLQDANLPNSSAVAVFIKKPVGSRIKEKHAARADRWLAQLHALAKDQQ